MMLSSYYFGYNVVELESLEFTDKLIGKVKEASDNHRFDKKYNIEHRLTTPHTPQTNGMVERVNGTIKNATIKARVI